MKNFGALKHYKNYTPALPMTLLFYCSSLLYIKYGSVCRYMRVLRLRIFEETSTNWCILVAKLNIPDGLNHHLQHPTACLIQNARWGLEICQTLSCWIKMAKRVWKGAFEEEVEKNGKNSGSLTLLPVDCLNLNSDQLQCRCSCQYLL